MKYPIPPVEIQKRVYDLADELGIPADDVKRTYYECYVGCHEYAIGVLRDRLLIKYFLPKW